MSKSQQWFSVWLCMILFCALFLSGGEGSVTVMAGTTGPNETFNAQERSLILRTDRGQFSVFYTKDKGISVEELTLEEKKLREQKRTARGRMKENLMKNLLASRAVHLTQYAKWVKLQEGIKVARDAERYIGTPYVWGGTTPEGFDCSGFTQYIFAKHGVFVPRNSYEQFEAGKPVQKQDLQPGDLVFFTTYAPGPSHLGIYIGEGKFVHALNNSTGVIASPLDNDYYKTRFVGAKRVI
jgi:hypothetical protein